MTETAAVNSVVLWQSQEDGLAEPAILIGLRPRITGNIKSGVTKSSKAEDAEFDFVPANT